MNDKSNRGLAQDTLTLLRRRNQGQRKAIKVENNMRCVICTQLLLIPPTTAQSDRPNKVVILSNRTGYHQACHRSSKEFETKGL